MSNLWADAVHSELLTRCQQPPRSGNSISVGITDRGPMHGKVRFPKRVWCEDPTTVEKFEQGANLAGSCSYPILLQLNCNRVDAVTGDKFALQREVMVRCRKCPACRDHAGRCWMARGIAEASRCSRNWFLTLTFDWRRAPISDVKSQIDFAVRELTLFFKKQRFAGWKFRYLAVVEPHKSGRPHIHVLLHDLSTRPITKRQIGMKWTAGFWKAKLVDDPVRAVKYTVKYMFKDGLLARVRASIKYGSSPASSQKPNLYDSLQDKPPEGWRELCATLHTPKGNPTIPPYFPTQPGTAPPRERSKGLSY